MDDDVFSFRYHTVQHWTCNKRLFLMSSKIKPESDCLQAGIERDIVHGMDKSVQRNEKF